VLTGGGSLLKNIDLLAEYHTGLPARIGHPVEHLAHGYTTQLASPIYSTAVGLLKYSIDNIANAKNAYVEEFKQITSVIQEDKIEKVQPRDLYEDQDESDDMSDDTKEGKKGKGIFNKLFTFTKDFFETVPDSEF
jgi:cell division protein FtsA